MSDDTPTVARAGTYEVLTPLYTQIHGDAVAIGKYGQARNTEPCWVPESVAVEMAQDEDMRHRLGPAPLAPIAAETVAPDEPAVEEDDNPPRRRGRK